MTKHSTDASAAAQLTDDLIDSLLMGGERPGADPAETDVLRHLLAVHRPSAPPTVESAVAGRLREVSARPSGVGWGVRVAAFLVGATFLGQAGLSLFAGEQLARFLGLGFEPHIYAEGGIAYLGLALGALAGAWRPAHLSIGVATAAPAAILLGIFGLMELPHAPNPAAELFHVAQAVLACLLLGLWARGALRRKA